MTVRFVPAAQDLADLIYEEARLLDAAEYRRWLALYAADGRYWVPMSARQTEPRTEQAIAFEDKLLLAIRIDRLEGPKTYSHQSRIACQHVLQAPRVEIIDATGNRHVTRTPFIYVESRGDHQTILAGTVRHEIRVEEAALRIVEKRVDLVNAGSALQPIFLFL